MLGGNFAAADRRFRTKRAVETATVPVAAMQESRA
jgi:cytochrome c-type biogenesis protein CcmF